MINANVIGLDQFIQQIQSAQQSVQNDVANEIRVSAMQFENLAKQSASSFGDRGTLRQSISHRQIDRFTYEVFVGTFYAPFIEFGTKSKVQVPSGLENVASQFRGLTGAGSLSLIEAIKGWVIRKQIASQSQADSVAFVIAKSILRNGISPKPFFYRHIATVRTNLIDKIQQILNAI